MRIYPLSLAVDLDEFPYVEEDKVRYPFLADFIEPQNRDQAFDPEDWSDCPTLPQEGLFDDFEYDAE